jgi:peptide/nickel transport system substrate-binding protein
MRSRKAGALLLALLLTGGLAGGCSNTQTEPSTPALVVATPAPKTDVTTLNVVLPQDVTTLHPLRATQREVRSLLGLVYESLVAYDENGNPAGELAASLEPDDTARVWTITLRKQVRWQRTGRALASDDVIYTLDLIRQIGAEGAYYPVLSYIENWEKVDDSTVKITFIHGFMGNIMALDFPVLPMDGGYSASSVPDEASGTGPYVMGALAKDQDLTLTANESWWKQQPKIRTIVAKRYADTQAAATSLVLRQLDAVQTEDLVTDQYSYSGDANTYEYVTPYLEFLAFNMQSTKVADGRFRQAVALSLDRKSIVETVYMNHATLADSPFFPGNAMLNTQLTRQQDTAKAKELLTAMGWNSQTSLTLLTDENQANPLRSDAAKLIAKTLGELGVTVEVVAKPWDEFSADLAAGTFDMVLTGWYTGTVPDLGFALSSTGAGNFMKYASPDMDALLTAFLESGKNGFADALAAVKAQIDKDLPLITLYFRNHTLLTGSQVVGVGRVEEADAFATIDQWRMTGSK